MIDFSEVALVWAESVNLNQPATTNSVGAGCWGGVTGQRWLRWTRGSMPDLSRHKVAIVNIFHTSDSTHIWQIKSTYPGIKVIACPDPSLDWVLAHPTEWRGMWDQMVLADYIGGRTAADERIYGQLLNKPTFYLPSPIGPDDYFAPFRELEKGDYLLTLDHSFAPQNTLCNIAAVAAIQRRTGVRVIYAADRDWTPAYATLAGLHADFVGHVDFPDFVDLAARAKVCVDMYASHSYGRQQMLCAMVGTPIVGSALCKEAPGVKVDPFAPDHALNWVSEWLTTPNTYQFERDKNLRIVQQYFGFEASAKRLRSILDMIEAES